MRRDLDDRLRKFVKRILNLAVHLRTIEGALRIADQISRSGPSIRFNYAESQAASSRTHFITIIETAEREARETVVRFGNDH
ncbi:four helix bundle protein [Candidatus Poribacteria bacterium]|nr:four helix bundle protein [Candidatus Poribacteria bacterium]